MWARVYLDVFCVLYGGYGMVSSEMLGRMLIESVHETLYPLCCVIGVLGCAWSFPLWVNGLWRLCYVCVCSTGSIKLEVGRCRC